MHSAGHIAGSACIRRHSIYPTVVYATAAIHNAPRVYRQDVRFRLLMDRAPVIRCVHLLDDLTNDASCRHYRRGRACNMHACPLQPTARGYGPLLTSEHSLRGFSEVTTVWRYRNSIIITA